MSTLRPTQSTEEQEEMTGEIVYRGCKNVNISIKMSPQCKAAQKLLWVHSVKNIFLVKLQEEISLVLVCDLLN